MRILRFLGWTVLLSVAFFVGAWLGWAGVAMMVDAIGALNLMLLLCGSVLFFIILNVAWEMSAEDWGGESE